MNKKTIKREWQQEVDQTLADLLYVAQEMCGCCPPDEMDLAREQFADRVESVRRYIRHLEEKVSK